MQAFALRALWRAALLRGRRSAPHRGRLAMQRTAPHDLFTTGPFRFGSVWIEPTEVRAW